MATKETTEYFQTWDIRLNAIDTKTLNGLFEKFGALFTAFNRLYNDAYEYLKATQKITKPRIADWERAIVIPVDFIGADAIVNAIAGKNGNTDIENIIKLMNAGVFAINLVDGQPQESVDEDLKTNLQSSDASIKARAILSLIYQIRNNIQHGQKHYEEHQRLLLEPVISILEKLLKLMRANFGL